MTAPITPQEAIEKKNASFPDEIIDAFNELIAQDFDGFSATVYQKDVVALIKKKLKIESSDVIFKKKWLDVEPIFRKAGWEVDFDKPGYNESYEPCFKFSRKKK